MKQLFCFAFSLVFLTSSVFSQTNISEQLTKDFKKAKSDTSRIIILEKLINNEKNDSIINVYERQISSIVEKDITSSINEQDKKVYKLFKAQSIQREAIRINNKNDFKKAYDLFNQCLELSKEINHEKLIVSCLNRIGLINFNWGNTDVALDFYMQSLAISTRLKRKDEMASSLNNIGLVYNTKGDNNKALEYFEKSYNIQDSLRNKSAAAKSLGNIGIVYYKMGNYPKALDYFKKCYEIRKGLGDLNDIGTSLMYLGVIYDVQGDIAQALDYYIQSLKVQEKIGNKFGISSASVNIGQLYTNQKDYAKSLEYFNKGLTIFNELNDKNGMAYTLYNMGISYGGLNNTEKEIDYYQRSLKLRREVGDKSGIAQVLNSIGTYYLKIQKYDQALEYDQECLKIQEQIDDKNFIPITLSNLASIYLEYHQTEKAFELAKKAYKISRTTGYCEAIRVSSEILEKICYKMGDYKNSRKYYEEFILMRDSVSKIENQKFVQQKYFQYQYEKKAATDSIAHSKAIEIKNLQLEKSEHQKHTQRVIIYFFVVGFILVTIFLGVIVNLLINKKRANELLEKQNIEISQQKEEIVMQRDEIEAQRDLVTEQKNKIETIHEELTSSIRYAWRIQGALLPSSEQMKELLGEHFVLFLPKDIVSGDFYWVTKFKQYTIFCVADCTGHGVPGAFMSMLGISFLNEIVHKEGVTLAVQILEHLRKNIIYALKQKGEVEEQKDGMDINLCVIDTSSNEMQFAGGYNPCWIIPNPAYSEQRVIVPELKAEDIFNDGSLIQLKGDKMPIAIHKHMKPFTNHLVQLYPGDQLYIMSDGYEDQFGGTSGRKFMVKALRELVIANGQLPMEQQKQQLEQTLREWMNGYEQLDDITMLGIRISEQV